MKEMLSEDEFAGQEQAPARDDSRLADVAEQIRFAISALGEVDDTALALFALTEAAEVLEQERARTFAPAIGKGDPAPAVLFALSPALVLRIDDLARDVGRLRRLLEPRGYVGHLADRIAGHVETLDVMLAPSAAEILAANLWFCGDETVALEAVLEDADARAQHLRRLLGSGQAA
jgi:hypothetical protein